MMNFKHLHYFWVVAKQGGIVRAAENLHITPQTISGQIQLLEQQIGKKLFFKQGRQLQLTETGTMVFGYAEQIFALGNELQKRLKADEHEYRHVLQIGIVDSLPKSVTTQLLLPLMQAGQRYKIVCREERIENLVHEMQLNRLDLILSDSAVEQHKLERLTRVLLGASCISFVAAQTIIDRIGSEFPQCLNASPMLIPAQDSVIRNEFLAWSTANQLTLNIVGEFDDSALMKAFGQAGVGTFMVPSDIVNEVSTQYQVCEIGRTEQIQYQYYMITRPHPSETTAQASQILVENAETWLGSAKRVAVSQ